MAKRKNFVGTQQILLHPDTETKSILQYLCEQSGKLYNTGVYFARQTLFKTGNLLTGKFDLLYEDTIAKSALFSSLPSVVAQQTLISVTESFKSFKELKDKFLNGELVFKPRPPDYLTGSKLFKVAYHNSGAGRPTLVNGQIRFALGLTVKRWFGISEFFLPMPSNINYSRVKEFTILPKNGAFYLEMSYELDKPEKIELDINQALSIDLGTADNLAACVDTLGNSFLIDSRQLKAMNQLWNKRVSTRKEGQPQGYWDDYLDEVTRKRNHQMRDGINKAARIIIDHCLKHSIGTLVIGWNEGFKNGIDLGKNNQNFVQIPLGKLKERLKQLCELNGIRFVVTEEAYTSKSSFLDGDSLPEYGQTPIGWKASGKRIKRGLYQSMDGTIVNADLQAAANILRKVAGKLSISLDQLSRRCLTTVARIRLWVLPNLTLSAESQWL